MLQQRAFADAAEVAVPFALGVGTEAATTAPIQQVKSTLHQWLDYERWVVWGQRAALIGVVIVAKR